MEVKPELWSKLELARSGLEMTIPNEQLEQEVHVLGDSSSISTAKLDLHCS